MKVFIGKIYSDAEILLYDMLGIDCTEKYMVSRFGSLGFNRLTDNEKETFGTAADYSMPLVCYELFAECIGDIQKGIYAAADDIAETGADVSVFTVDGRNALIM